MSLNTFSILYLQGQSSVPFPYRRREFGNTWTTRFIQLSRAMTAQAVFLVSKPYGSPGGQEVKPAHCCEGHRAGAHNFTCSSL